jgi:hypothetical protein
MQKETAKSYHKGYIDRKRMRDQNKVAEKSNRLAARLAMKQGKEPPGTARAGYAD